MTKFHEQRAITPEGFWDIYYSSKSDQTGIATNNSIKQSKMLNYFLYSTLGNNTYCS